MANNQPWKMESMKSFRRHIDPEMEERLKWTKIGNFHHPTELPPLSPLQFYQRFWDNHVVANNNRMPLTARSPAPPFSSYRQLGTSSFSYSDWKKSCKTEKKLKKSLKLVKSINQNKEGNAKKKAELTGIIEEISKEYKSMHDLYDSLTSDARKIFTAENEAGSSSGYSSAGNSDMEFHTPKAPDTPISLASRDKKEGKKNESSDSEDALLKDKLTSSSEVKKRPNEDDETEPETGLVFKDVEIEDEQLLSLEIRTAEVKSLEDKVKSLEAEVDEMSAIKKAQTEENSALKARIGELDQLSMLIEKLEQDKKGLQEELSKNMVLNEQGVKELENQIMSAKSEAYKQRVENERLYARIFVLETTVKKRENESSALREKADVHEQKLQNLHEKIQSLEEQESSQTQIADQQKLLTDMQNEVNNLKEENRKMQNSMNEAKSNYQIAEKKVEEMSEEFFKKCEDQVRILSRRIRVAEQLHVESKDWYKKTKDSYEQQNQELKQRLEQNEVWLRNITNISQTVGKTLSSLESMAMKFEGSDSNFQNRISKVSCELKFAKGWVARKNKTAACVRDELNSLLLQLDDKESEILRYREKVWRSEHKARELEKLVGEKEEGMLVLQEEKREAIRQLCVWIDYHRGHSDYYKKILSDMNVNSGKKAR